jgi:hypothetical protein
MVCGGGSVQAGTVTPMAVVLTRAAMLFNAELRRARRRRTGFEIIGLPMNLIERFVRHAVAETTGTGAIVRYVQILFGSSPHDF